MSVEVVRQSTPQRLVQFYHDVIAEMKKVTWPDLPQVRQLSARVEDQPPPTGQQLLQGGHGRHTHPAAMGDGAVVIAGQDVVTHQFSLTRSVAARQ